MSTKSARVCLFYLFRFSSIASLVGRINKAYYLPRWCSTADYVKYFQAEGLVDVKRDDWTDNIQVPFALLPFDNELKRCASSRSLIFQYATYSYFVYY